MVDQGNDKPVWIFGRGWSNSLGSNNRSNRVRKNYRKSDKGIKDNTALKGNRGSSMGDTDMTLRPNRDYEMSGIDDLAPKVNKNRNMDGTNYQSSDIDMGGTANARVPRSARKHKKDAVPPHEYKKSLAEDSSSYALSATTIAQQAARESNFVGSAYFFNQMLPEVQESLQGDYVIVYARPRTSQAYPRNSAVQTFDPDFKNRVTIYTKVPKNGGIVPDHIIRTYLSNGMWAVGGLVFNGARIGLYLDHPEPRTKSYSDIIAETYPDQSTGTTLLDRVLAVGVDEDGSSARFGIKDMIFENNIQYGFEFIELTLRIWNQITGEKDDHIIVAVKVPKKGNISSAFILKQPLRIPPQSWCRWQRQVASKQNKLSNLVRNIEAVVSDWYNSDTDVMDRNEDQRGEAYWKQMHESR